MIFRISWTKKALQDLDQLGHFISRRIIKKVEGLSESPYSRDIRRLKGETAFRLRVGDYRIIFEIDGGNIMILKVGHRKNIYKR